MATIEGSALRPAVSIYDDFASAVVNEIAAMARQTKRELAAVFNVTGFDHAMDDSITPQSRIVINALRSKWGKRFNRLAKRAVRRMINRTLLNSDVTLRSSLKEASEHLSIDTTLNDQRLQDVIQASTQEAAQLIKRIPERFLGDVQGQVMRSITSGNGMADLVPYLTEKYRGDVKWARHVAMDQTRKAYNNINAVKLQKMGCESFIWIHTGGGKHPRKEHIAMSGKEYRYDDLPIIDKRSGERGLPGTAIFCRCSQKPVWKIGKET